MKASAPDIRAILFDKDGTLVDFNRTFRADSVIAAGTVEELIDLWHPGLAAGERRDLIQAYDDYLVAAGSCRPIALDGLRQTLEALSEQEYLLRIATNDSEAGAKGTAEALGIEAMFASLLGYESVARPKPHRFAARHGLGSHQVVMAGDNRHDLEMARAARSGVGSKTVARRWAAAVRCRAAGSRHDRRLAIRSILKRKGEMPC